MIEITYLLIGAMLLIASFQSWKIFKSINTVDYLIFSLVFLFVALDTIIISLGHNGSFLDFLSYIVYMSLLYYLQFRLDDDTNSRKFTFPSILFVLLCLVMVVSYPLEDIFELLLYLRFLAADIVLIIVGLKILLVHLRSSVMYKSRKTLLAKNSWIVLGLILLLIGIIRGIVFIIQIYRSILNDIPASLSEPLIASTQIIITVGFISFGLIMLMMIFISPEVLILTETQIYNIGRLYDIINGDKPEKSYSPVNQVYEYLHDLDFHLQNVDDE